MGLSGIRSPGTGLSRIPDSGIRSPGTGLLRFSPHQYTSISKSNPVSGGPGAPLPTPLDPSTLSRRHPSAFVGELVEINVLRCLGAGERSEVSQNDTEP